MNCLQGLANTYRDINSFVFKQPKFITALYEDLMNELNNNGENSEYFYLLLTTIGGLTSINDPFFIERFMYNGIIEYSSTLIHLQNVKNIKQVIWIL